MTIPLTPLVRPRRLRTTPAMRRLVAETRINPGQLVLPVFVADGLEAPRPIGSLPGVVQHTLDSVRAEAERAAAAGLGGIMLFGVPAEADKDAVGSVGARPDGILNRGVAAVRDAIGDDLVVMASEAGVLHHIPESRIVKKWRLQPGKMFLIDLEQGRIIDDKELKDQLAASKPYRQWIERIRVKLDEVEADGNEDHEDWTPSEALLDRQQGVALVEDVVGQQDLASAHRRGRAMQPGQAGAGGLAAITRGVQVVELQIQPEFAQRERELRGERQPAVHHREVQRHVAVGIGRTDLVGHAHDRRFQRGLVEDDMRRRQCIRQLRSAHATSPTLIAPEVAPASCVATGTVASFALASS